MRPLHRIADWEPHPVRVSVICCLLSWASGAASIFVVAAAVVVNTRNVNSARLMIALAIILILAAVIQSLRLLWLWEEKQPAPPTTKSLQDRIDELEHELGMGVMRTDGNVPRPR